MTYYCEDCSYRGKVSGAGGECPACGSFNISRRGANTDNTPSPKKWRLVLLVVLWVVLILMIIWKLIS